MPLTDLAIKKAKPTAKLKKLPDGGGLYLAIPPSGSKLWRWKYRVAGREKLLALGTYPVVTLPEARAAHLAAAACWRKESTPAQPASKPSKPSASGGRGGGYARGRGARVDGAAGCG